ncbi:MAG: hypothetical protein SGJ17_08305, partial [Hyphomicrobiales bacterium]|nr:hypothetical protein [Hyphomicrobiales bacterium]
MAWTGASGRRGDPARPRNQSLAQGAPLQRLSIVATQMQQPRGNCEHAHHSPFIFAGYGICLSFKQVGGKYVYNSNGRSANLSTKLSINIAWRSFSYIFRNFLFVMRIGFLPLLLIVATYTLIFIYFVALVVVTDPQTVPSQEFVQQSIWLNVIVIPIQLLVSTMFIV